MLSINAKLKQAFPKVPAASWRFLTPKEINDWVGPPCEEYEEGCACCDFWLAHNTRRTEVEQGIANKDLAAVYRAELQEMQFRKEMVDLEIEYRLTNALLSPQEVIK